MAQIEAEIDDEVCEEMELMASTLSLTVDEYASQALEAFNELITKTAVQ